MNYQGFPKWRFLPQVGCYFGGCFEHKKITLCAKKADSKAQKTSPKNMNIMGSFVQGVYNSIILNSLSKETDYQTQAQIFESIYLCNLNQTL